MPRIRSTRKTSSDALDAAKVTLRAIQASADAFPPLKSAVSGVLVVLELTENVRSNKKGCKHIATRAAQLVQDIWSQTKDLDIVLPNEVKESIRKIRRLLKEIKAFLEELNKENLFQRLARQERNKIRIDEYGRLLDEAMMHFSVHFHSTLLTFPSKLTDDIWQINLELSLNANLHRLHAKSAAAQDAILVASHMSESERLVRVFLEL
ncbi:hypothetical protein FB45DRAFT_949578 [Roridomyces roridus]|uniref:Uncharacterized protein n=1 Tax=Roridomyces roridus TaxID=1738132 RepID=A0AAD7B0R1_9AGAR|nr:hypothetical protein FB45DRAFT_949578 [Roridomyces roridus]